MKRYSKRAWLNREESNSTGSVVAFDGLVTNWERQKRSTFLQISDCQKSIKLHMTEDDKVEHFIAKMELLRNEIDSFIEHLAEHL